MPQNDALLMMDYWRLLADRSEGAFRELCVSQVKAWAQVFVSSHATTKGEK
jgi:hypothetical protein